MKTIWLILLVMALFNGFLFTFNMFFETPDVYHPTNISDSNLSGYAAPGNAGLTLVTGLVQNNALGLLTIFIGFLITLATKNLKYLAAGAMAGIINGLWVSTASVFTNIMNSNVVIMSIYYLMSICIGIIVAILVLGIFTEQEQLQ